MGRARMKPKLISVRFEKVPGDRFMAISDDLPGLMVAGASVDELRRLVSTAIEELFAQSGEAVIVDEIETRDREDCTESFVAFPQRSGAGLAMAS